MPPQEFENTGTPSMGTKTTGTPAAAKVPNPSPDTPAAQPGATAASNATRAPGDYSGSNDQANLDYKAALKAAAQKAMESGLTQYDVFYGMIETAEKYRDADKQASAS